MRFSAVLSDVTGSPCRPQTDSCREPSHTNDVAVGRSSPRGSAADALRRSRHDPVYHVAARNTLAAASTPYSRRFPASIKGRSTARVGHFVKLLIILLVGLGGWHRAGADRKAIGKRPGQGASRGRRHAGYNPADVIQFSDQAVLCEQRPAVAHFAAGMRRDCGLQHQTPEKSP